MPSFTPSKPVKDGAYHSNPGCQNQIRTPISAKSYIFPLAGPHFVRMDHDAAHKYIYSLPWVLPIVVYNGSEPWAAARGCGASAAP